MLSLSTAIRCGALTIQDGTVEYDSTGPPFDVGTVANFSCDDGFFLSGNSSNTCVNISTVRWNNEAPVCQSELSKFSVCKHRSANERSL